MWFVFYGYAEVIVYQVASKYIEANVIYLQTWTVLLVRFAQNLNVKCMVLSVSMKIIVITVVVGKAEIHFW